MINPFTSLIVASLTVTLISFIFWPKSGFFWKWQRGTRNTMRVLIEDALKHLYDLEYQGLKCRLQSISGTLSISGEQAAKLMARLESLGLVKSQDEGFQLTSEGRSYALRMIRIHRLWERYLADETGLAETEWHNRAEILEHHMTDEEAEALAANVGHPSYDPHGDPIPTPSGSLPPKQGQALTDLAEGKLAQIIHIEDEPNAIYAQLVAQGLHPGVQLRMLEKTPERIHFIADGEENVLAPVVASNVTVVPLPKQQKIEGPYDSLVSLNIGEKGEVIGISKACHGQQRRRLLDLGVIPGTVISVEMRSAGGDPTAYNIRGASIALRNKQAEMIHIRRVKEVV
ncbi:MAG: iron dependent repressor, metal binding and dimerization domain protein [bacterium]